jgi:hypothetical protein
MEMEGGGWGGWWVMIVVAYAFEKGARQASNAHHVHTWEVPTHR